MTQDPIAANPHQHDEDVPSPPFTLAELIPLTEDPLEQSMRADLASRDLATSTNAALRLGAHYLDRIPKLGEPLLRQATNGPPLTAARAMLRLACMSFEAGDTAAAREFLASAQDRTKQAWYADGEINESFMRLRIDVAVAFACAGQADAAIDILSPADTALRRQLRSLAPSDPDAEQLRRLAGLVNLRLGQTQTVGDRFSADAAYRLASTYGSRSVAATAAWDLGRMLEHYGGDGPDIEEQYRRAAESGDPIVAPQAMISLGDLLWRNNRRDVARGWWESALRVGGDEIPARVTRRLSGQWPSDDPDANAPVALRPAPPLTDHSPPTPLGRVASGRASTFVAATDGDRVRTVVVGGGTGGHYLQPGLQYDYEVVGYIDDDPDVLDVNGVPVLGPIAQLSAILQGDSTIALVIFAIPTASGATRLKVLEAALRWRRRLLSLPSMFELLRGHPLVPQLRPLEVHETFGDGPWLVDRAAAALVRGRRVAIVGAGSWIGDELARRVANGQARHLLLIDQASGSLMRILGELRELRDVVDCDARIVDCAERHSLNEVFGEFKPEIVFHCAALTHSPAEVLPLAHAARVNILATETVAAVAEAHGATDFVTASADRASHRATNFDMTKAIAERAVLAVARALVQHEHSGLAAIGDHDDGFRVSVLRFPNVWAKDGPVVGRLIHQLSKGGPIRAAATAERCFISAWEAAQAMLRLVDDGHNGGLFAYCGGDVVLIREVAERLIWINGLTAGRDVRIVDQPSADTKASIKVIGAGETQGERVAHETYHVVQSPDLVARLDERVALFRSAWSKADSTALKVALTPDITAAAPALAAG